MLRLLLSGSRERLPCLGVSGIRMASSKPPRTKAVIFDMGGVIIPSPLPYFRQFEKKHGIAEGVLTSVILKGGDSSVWGRLECGEYTAEQYPDRFSAAIKEELGRELPEEIVTRMTQSHTEVTPFPEMIDAIRCIRAEGVKTALLTNNYFMEEGKSYQPLDIKNFDLVIESCREGIRKPNPVIYHRTLEKLKVRPEEAIFLDDLGPNLKSARSLGIHTIKVSDTNQALDELQKALGFSLQGFVPGTTSVKKAFQLPVDSLEKYLQDVIGLKPNGEPINIRKFHHGQSNPTYYIKYGEKELVLRKKPPGKLLPSAHAVEREYKVMKALEEAGVPVPKCLDLCEDTSVVGTPFYVMDYVRGRIFKHGVLPGMKPEERKSIYSSMNEVLAKIHSIDVEKAGLGDYGKKGNYVKRQIDRWSKQYNASKTHEIPSMSNLMEWLPKYAPSTDQTTVVHGDFRIDNLIYDENSSEILAILDWELSTLGDPLSDLAYNCILHHLPSNFPVLQGFSGKDISELGIPTDKEYMEEYCKRMGIPVVENWNFYLAFSFFRISAILQGVYQRSLQGQSSQAEGAKMLGLLAEKVADIGWTFAQKDEKLSSSSEDKNDANSGHTSSDSQYSG